MYNEKYFHGVGSNYDPVLAPLMMKAYFRKVLRDLQLKSMDKVLEIGCAFGYFLRHCDEIGCETYGIDISQYAIDQAKKHTRATLYVHDVDEGLMFENHFFDLVIMFDVLEHLKSPFNVLKDVHRVLKPNGKLILTTANLNALDRLFKKLLKREEKWHGFVDTTHLYLFTPTSLRFLVKQVGFKIIILETPFHPLPQFIQRIANKTGFGGQIWLVAQK